MAALACMSPYSFGHPFVERRKNWTRVQIQEASADPSIFPNLFGLALPSQGGTSTSFSHPLIKMRVSRLISLIWISLIDSPSLSLLVKCVEFIITRLYHIFAILNR